MTQSEIDARRHALAAEHLALKAARPSVGSRSPMRSVSLPSKRTIYNRGDGDTASPLPETV
jgi:hypothetical protein